MTQYIDKSALVAEIESKKKCAQTLGDNAINNSMQQFYDGMKQGYVDFLSFLDTLEVKEADLDFTKEVNMWIRDNGDTSGFFNVQELAKYFFELGIKAQKGE